MSYYCEICNYTATRKYCIEQHYKSDSHKNNELNCKLKNEEVKKYKKEIEIKVKNKYKNIISKLENELNEYKNKYQHIIEKTNENLNESLKLALENNNKALETTNQINKTTKKSMSAINYLIKNHPDNLSFYSYNLDTIPDNDLAMIATNPKHLSKVLVTTFIGTDLRKAGIRCLDATRLRFSLKGEEGWVIDISGEIIKEKAIKPITEKAYQFINNRMKQIIDKRGNNISTDEIIAYQKGIENIKKLSEDLMQNKILKKFGSKCMIDRTKLLY
jgi:hypothetical protein